MLAAGKSGKLKTAVTMVSIVAMLLIMALMESGLLAASFPLKAVSYVLIWICGALTVYSGAEYLWKNRSQFTGSM